jgi:hypothetical protein
MSLILLYMNKRLSFGTERLLLLFTFVVLLFGLGTTKIEAGGGPSIPLSPLSGCVASTWLMIALLIIIILLLIIIAMCLAILHKIRLCCCNK